MMFGIYFMSLDERNQHEVSSATKPYYEISFLKSFIVNFGDATGVALTELFCVEPDGRR